MSTYIIRNSREVNRWQETESKENEVLESKTFFYIPASNGELKKKIETGCQVITWDENLKKLKFTGELKNVASLEKLNFVMSEIINKMPKNEAEPREIEEMSYLLKFYNSYLHKFSKDWLSDSQLIWNIRMLYDEYLRNISLISSINPEIKEIKHQCERENVESVKCLFFNLLTENDKIIVKQVFHYLSYEALKDGFDGLFELTLEHLSEEQLVILMKHSIKMNKLTYFLPTYTYLKKRIIGDEKKIELFNEKFNSILKESDFDQHLIDLVKEVDLKESLEINEYLSYKGIAILQHLDTKENNEAIESFIKKINLSIEVLLENKTEEMSFKESSWLQYYLDIAEIYLKRLHEDSNFLKVCQLKEKINSLLLTQNKDFNMALLSLKKCFSVLCEKIEVSGLEKAFEELEIELNQNNLEYFSSLALEQGNKKIFEFFLRNGGASPERIEILIDSALNLGRFDFIPSILISIDEISETSIYKMITKGFELKTLMKIELEKLNIQSISEMSKVSFTVQNADQWMSIFKFLQAKILICPTQIKKLEDIKKEFEDDLDTFINVLNDQLSNMLKNVNPNRQKAFFDLYNQYQSIAKEYLGTLEENEDENIYISEPKQNISKTKHHLKKIDYIIKFDSKFIFEIVNEFLSLPDKKEIIENLSKVDVETLHYLAYMSIQKKSLLLFEAIIEHELFSDNNFFIEEAIEQKSWEFLLKLHTKVSKNEKMKIFLVTLCTPFALDALEYFPPEYISQNANSILGLAAFRGSLSIAEKFIQLKADINTQAQDGGFSPLHLAVLGSHKEIIKLLLESGADKSLKNTDGKTCLDLAKENNNEEIIALLS